MITLIIKKNQLHLVLNKLFIMLFGIVYAFLLLQVAEIGSRDFIDYIKYFDCLPTDTCEVQWEVEQSAKLIASLIQPSFGSVSVIYLYIFFAVIVKLLAFNKMHNKFYAFLIYNLSFAVLLEITQIRAAVAIAFAILSLCVYLEKRKVIALILFAISIYFHNSVIILIMILLPFKYILVSIVIFILSISGIEKYVMFIEAIDPSLIQLLRLSSLLAYFQNQVTPSLINVKNLMVIILVLPIIMKWLSEREKSIVFNGYFLYVMSVCGMYFYSGDLFSRISDIYLVITLTYIAGFLKGHTAYKIVLFICALITFLSSLKLLGFNILADY
jgi:hypothetical protein